MASGKEIQVYEDWAKRLASAQAENSILQSELELIKSEKTDVVVGKIRDIIKDLDPETIKIEISLSHESKYDKPWVSVNYTKSNQKTLSNVVDVN